MGVTFIFDKTVDITIPSSSYEYLQAKNNAASTQEIEEKLSTLSVEKAGCCPPEPLRKERASFKLNRASKGGHHLAGREIIKSQQSTFFSSTGELFFICQGNYKKIGGKCERRGGRLEWCISPVRRETTATGRRRARRRRTRWWWRTRKQSRTRNKMKSQTARVGSDDKDSASDVRATILSIILKDLNFISRAGGEQSKQAGLNNKHSVG